MFSTRHLFSDSFSTISADSWLQNSEEIADANKMDERGLCPLIYAAGWAHTELFSSLLARTDLSSVFSILEEKRTTLLQVIVEAPLASGSALECTHHVQTPLDKDPSLASLGEEKHGTMDHQDTEGERGHGVCTSTSSVDHEDDEGNEYRSPPSTRRNTVDSDSLQCLESLQAYDRLASYLGFSL